MTWGKAVLTAVQDIVRQLEVANKLVRHLVSQLHKATPRQAGAAATAVARHIQRAWVTIGKINKAHKRVKRARAWVLGWLLFAQQKQETIPMRYLVELQGLRAIAATALDTARTLISDMERIAAATGAVTTDRDAPHTVADMPGPPTALPAEPAELTNSVAAFMRAVNSETSGSTGGELSCCLCGLFESPCPQAQLSRSRPRPPKNFAVFCCGLLQCPKTSTRNRS